MKWFCVLILFQLLRANCFADNPPLEQLSYPFKPTNIDLVWKAPTNDLPRSLWVYRVLPTEFSPAVISNMIALGSFTAKDRRNVPGYPHMTSFATSDENKSFSMDPDKGFFEYRNSDADDMHIAEGVPDAKQTFELATNYLAKFGIELSDLAHKPHSSELRTYKASGKAMLSKGAGIAPYATNIHMCGVYFIRSLGGVDFYGRGVRGGCTFEFGHHAKIANIIVGWRKLKRDKLYQVARPETIVKWVQEGKAFLESDGSRHVDWPGVRRLNITKVTPYYFGEPYSEPQEWVYPFVTLEATVDGGEPNRVVYIDCPILEKAPGKPLK